MERTQDSSTEASGGLLAGRYRVESPLGRGATGVVYRARRLSDDAPVALKLLWASGDTPLQGRFLRGARLASRIQHPGVVRTLDFGRLGDERGRLYVAMELVEGVALDKVGPQLPDLGSRVGLLIQVLEALDHVHARGVLHRDIKPANVLVSRQPDGSLRARLVDFGLAAASASLAEDAADASLSLPGTVLGTPLYMAPEQAEGLAPDAPSVDLYPIGVMLYQLLSGRLPFEGAPLSVIAAKLTRPAPPMSPLPGLDVPEALVELTARLVARRPADRLPLAADVLAALEPYARPPRITADRWREAMLAAGRSAGSSWSQGSAGQPGSSATLDLANLSAADDLAPPPGRDELVARALDLAAEVEGGAGRAVMLVGAPGMGRSVTIEHLCVRLAERGRFRVLRATCREDMGLVDSLRMAIEGLLGVSGRARPAVAAAAREMFAGLGAADDSEAEALAALLRPTGEDPSFAAEQQGRLFAMLMRMLRRLGRYRPVALALDDLDRGGPTASALLEFVLFELTLEPAPILLLGTLTEGRAASAALARTGRYEGSARFTLTLGPIPPAALAAALVERQGIGQAEALHVARKSAGSPLVATLLAQGLSPSSRATLLDWQKTRGERVGSSGGSISGETMLPMPLRDMLMVGLESRLARASDPELLRGLLQDASVLGSAVPIELLARLVADRMDRGELDQRLDELLDLGLFTLREGPGEEVVLFSPELLGDMLRSGLNARRARRLHQRAYDVRLSWAGDELEAEAGALGDHLEALGDRTGAARWWLRGMWYELAGGDALRGVMLGRRALEAMPPTEAEATEIALTLGRLLLDLGDLEQAEALLEPLVDGVNADLALRAGDLLGDVYENRGAGERWMRLLERMQGREADAGPAGRRALRTARALWLNYAGRGRESTVLAQEALEGDASPAQVQRGTQRLAFAWHVAGDTDRALAAARLSVEAAGQRPDLRVRALRTLGVIHLGRREWEPAITALDAGLALARRAGLLARVPILLADLADARRGMGDLAVAREGYRIASRTAERLGMLTPSWIADAKDVFCALLTGDLHGVASRTERMMADANSLGLIIARNYVRLLRAWFLAQIGQSEESLEVLASAGHPSQLLFDPQAGLALERLAVSLRRAHDPVGWTAAQRDLLTLAVETAARQAREHADETAAGRCEALILALPMRAEP